jgi:hypothetical protein
MIRFFPGNRQPRLILGLTGLKLPWRRMLDSHHQPSTPMFTGVRVSGINFYAIFLRH